MREQSSVMTMRQLGRAAAAAGAGANASAPPAGLASMIDRLEAVLDRLTEEHDHLDAAAATREQAVRGADMRLLASCVGNESQIVSRIARLDGERVVVVRYFVEMFKAPDAGETTATWIAERLQEADRDRILGAAARLRAAIERVQSRNEAAKSAAETLAAHMQGLLRAAEGKLSHSGTYGRRGAVEAGARVVSALDCTS